jgi:hypothetical protein
MSMKRLTLFVFAGIGVLLSVPSAIMAQDDAAAPPPGPPVETELVFEREVFDYPAFTRINPFRPLLATDTGGPRFEQLRVSGIIYSETRGVSVVIFSTSGVTIAEDGTLSAEIGDSFAVKEGQTIGNVTIVSITLNEVIVDVEEFGIMDRKTMRPLNILGGNQ